MRIESLYLQSPFDITLHLPIAQVFQIQAGESRRAKGSEETLLVGRYRDCYSIIEVCDIKDRGSRYVAPPMICQTTHETALELYI